MREEQEVARLEKAEADNSEVDTLKKLAEAEAAVAAKERAEEAARRQSALFVVPLNSAPPPPEFVAPTGGVGDEYPAMERESGDVVMLYVVVPPPRRLGERGTSSQRTRLCHQPKARW